MISSNLRQSRALWTAWRTEDGGTTPAIERMSLISGLGGYRKLGGCQLPAGLQQRQRQRQRRCWIYALFSREEEEGRGILEGTSCSYASRNRASSREAHPGGGICSFQPPFSRCISGPSSIIVHSCGLRVGHGLRHLKYQAERETLSAMRQNNLEK